jgi:hypothetical protein
MFYLPLGDRASHVFNVQRAAMGAFACGAPRCRLASRRGRSTTVGGEAMRRALALGHGTGAEVVTGSSVITGGCECVIASARLRRRRVERVYARVFGAYDAEFRCVDGVSFV